tara:strand:+ start:991 stop:2337 length:1347 start_codon:yes stop_codon:yes gene_type:complete
MAITLSSTKITTATVNTSVSANFAGPVDFSSAVISGEANKWQIVSANSNLSVNRNYFANTTGTGDATGIAMTLTLPSSANVGDTIAVIDQTANAQSNNVVIARNGNPIDGANRNVILNVQRGGVRLVYTGYGWTTKKVERETRFSGAQGETSGYNSGGEDDSARVDTIDKYPFASDTNASDVGNLSSSRSSPSGQSSLVSGYASGGLFPPAQSPRQTTTIDKFPFATDTNATNIGDLTFGRNGTAGHQSDVSGYVCGGYETGGVGETNRIEKYPFAVDTNATDIANLTRSVNYASGQSSKNNGYTSGGDDPGGPSFTNVIDKFPFATDANATDVGDLTVILNRSAGNNSETDGYVVNGESGPPNGPLDLIHKYPFASDTNATDVADTSQQRDNLTGQNSITHGYDSGGEGPPNVRVTTIDKFPFASESNSTDVGDLFQARRVSSGQQS